MTILQRQMVYVPDQLVKDARDKGMTNLSGFVREKLKEYVDTPVKSCQTAGGSTSQGGHT